MCAFLKVFLVTTILGFNFLAVEGIRCFQCNSLDNSGCSTLENYGKNLFYPTLCEEVFTNNQGPFCRKTVLQVLQKGRFIEPRVIRSCGYLRHKNKCYKTDNEGHQETVCQCFEDGCNAGVTLSSFGFLFIISFTAAIKIIVG